MGSVSAGASGPLDAGASRLGAFDSLADESGSLASGPLADASAGGAALLY